MARPEEITTEPVAVEVTVDLEEPLLSQHQQQLEPTAPPLEDDEIPVVSATAVTAENLPPTAPRVITVIAPLSLAAGATFVATLGGQPYQVTVPPGGVVEDQVFTANAQPLEHSIIPPTGRWKNGLCGCCAHGCCHPSLCCALWFPALATAQVMTRLKLNFLACAPTSYQGKSWAFPMVLLLTLAFFFSDVSIYVSPFLGIGSFTLYGLYTLYIVVSTRRAVRSRYRIRGNICCDLCCSAACMCCTVSQMSRHTGDYDTYAASCCSRTGLPDTAMVV